MIGDVWFPERELDFEVCRPSAGPVSVKGLRQCAVGDCKTVYLGSISGVAPSNQQLEVHFK
jgi:hypothetical protein